MQSDTALVHVSSPAICDPEASRAKGGGFVKSWTSPPQMLKAFAWNRLQSQ